jgi:phosphoesterase RecJ-like protein
MTEIVQKTAPKILAAIKAANNILLHCHPSPDPDSVGSALAMKFALEGMGKKATVIRGDSEIPLAFMHFPGADSIVPKNFFEVDLKEFDLFIVLDSGSLQMISRRGEVKFPETLKVIVIDHHATTADFGLINLIEPSYPACCQILFDLFKECKILITPDIAKNLFIGTYTDTGGFKYDKTTNNTFAMVAELSRIAPDFHTIISEMENGRKPGELVSLGLLLSNIKTFIHGHLAIASVSNIDLIKSGLTSDDVETSWVASLLRSVIGWEISVCCVEVSKGIVKASFRTRDSEKFDVTRLATTFGGGGHKAAAGATLTMPLPQAIEKIVATAKEIYNL